MIPPIAKVVYEARRALQQVVLDHDLESDEVTQLPKGALPFDELTSEQKEPLLAEVQAYLQSGSPMFDVLGQAIVDALK